jgi:tetratricopeptide (TPR) repeat protein
MRSEFSAQTLAEIFRDLYLAERSGTLKLRQHELEKRVYFERGMILFAESSLPEEDLGAQLIKEGRLSVGALTEGKNNLEDGATAQDLARVLVNRELIGRADVAATMRCIVDRVVQSVFCWTEGSAGFTDGLESDGVFETDILTTISVILDGVFKMAGFEPIHEAMQGLDNRLRVCRPTPIPLERLTLSPSHGYVLSRVDGNTSLADLITILPPGEEENAVRFLFGLLVLGVLEYDPPLSQGAFTVADIVRDHADRQALEGMQEQTIRQAYAEIRDQNPHQILGVEPGASHAETQRAYEHKKVEFSRERLLPRVRDKFRAELSVIESRVIEAFLTLTRPKAADAQGEPAVKRDDRELRDLNVHVHMDRAKAKVEIEKENEVADDYFSKARKAVREGDYHNAIQYGKLAISHNSSDARYYSLLADCQVRNPEARWQRLAEGNYSKATELDPWNAEYWMSLGRLYKTRGLNLRAKRQFEEALKLMPNNEEILEELSSVS